VKRNLKNYLNEILKWVSLSTHFWAVHPACLRAARGSHNRPARIWAPRRHSSTAAAGSADPPSLQHDPANVRSNNNNKSSCNSRRSTNEYLHTLIASVLWIKILERIRKDLILSAGSGTEAQVRIGNQIRKECKCYLIKIELSCLEKTYFECRSLWKDFEICWKENLSTINNFYTKGRLLKFKIATKI